MTDKDRAKHKRTLVDLGQMWLDEMDALDVDQAEFQAIAVSLLRAAYCRDDRHTLKVVEAHREHSGPMLVLDSMPMHSECYESAGHHGGLRFVRKDVSYSHRHSVELQLRDHELRREAELAQQQRQRAEVDARAEVDTESLTQWREWFDCTQCGSRDRVTTASGNTRCAWCRRTATARPYNGPPSRPVGPR